LKNKVKFGIKFSYQLNFLGYKVMSNRQTETGEIVDGCQTIFLRGSENIACLLSHGLCGSPYEVSFLADYLNKAGLNVYAPRYFGHGTTEKDMDKYNWYDWYEQLEKSYLELIKDYSKVYVIGFSLGGTLSLKLASKYNPEKLVVIGSFIKPAHRWYYGAKAHTYLKIFTRFFNYLPLISPPNVNDPKARKSYIGSRYFSLKAIKETLTAPEEVKKKLFKITSPLLIIHSKNDNTTCSSGSEYIFQEVSSEKKELIFFDKSNHLILLDYEKDLVFQKIKDFLIN